MKRFWQVGIAHVPYFSKVLWLRRLGKSAPKNGSCGGPATQDAAKICARPWRESGSEVKIVKSWRCRAIFEVRIRKICTVLWRESGFGHRLVAAGAIPPIAPGKLNNGCALFERRVKKVLVSRGRPKESPARRSQKGAIPNCISFSKFCTSSKDQLRGIPRAFHNRRSFVGLSRSSAVSGRRTPSCLDPRATPKSVQDWRTRIAYSGQVSCG